MNEKEIQFQKIAHLVYKAIETEVGEADEFKVETEWVVDSIHVEIKKILGLPADFHL